MSGDSTTISRRTALKIGGASFVGGAASLAGCTGGGDGGDGGDGGSDGGDGGSSGGGSNTLVKMALAPGGMSGIIMDYLEKDTSILADNMDAAGYDVEIQRTYDDVTLFASGQIQFAYPGPIDAARMAVERDIETMLLNKSVNMFPAWYTRPGSQFDPAEVGSLQQAIDNLAANGTYGTARWSAGTIPATQTIFQQHGYELKKEGGDIDLVIGGFEAMDRAVVQNQLDVATGSPMSGAAPDLIEDPPELAYVVQIIEEMKSYGLGAPAINSWGTSPEFLESDRAAAQALIDSWEEGVEWFFDDAEAILTDEAHWENISVDSEAAARYVYEWGVLNEHPLKEPVIVRDFRWNDGLEEDSRAFLEQVESLGQLGSGWADKITYVQDI